MGSPWKEQDKYLDPQRGQKSGCTWALGLCTLDGPPAWPWEPLGGKCADPPGK